MTDIAKLVARLELQSSQFQSELEKTNKKLLGFQKQSRDSLNAIEKHFRSFSTYLTTGFAAALSVGAFVGFVKSAVSAADAIGDAADRAGVLASDLSRLNYVARQSDVSFESLTNGVKEYQKNISEAAHGSKSAVDAFSALNLKAEQLKGLKLDEQLGLIAENFVTYVAETDRASVATQVFGKAGYELIPMLLRGKEGIADLAAESDRLGVTLDDNATKAIDRSTKALDRFWEAAKGKTANLFGNVALNIMGTTGDAVEDQIATINSLNQEKERLTKQIESGNLGRMRINQNNERIKQIQAEIAWSQAQLDVAARLKEGEDERREGLQATQRLIASFELPEVSAPKLPAIIFESDIADQRLENFMRVNAEQTAATREMYDEVTTLGKESANAITAKQIENSEYWLSHSKENVEKLTEFELEAQRRIENTIADTLRNGFEDGFRGVLKSFGDMLLDMAAEAAAANFGKYLFGNQSAGGTESGVIGGFLTWLGGNTTKPSGTRATGGPVMAGGAYLVGERGPELFSPGTSGSITANHALGGVVIHNSYSFAPGSNVSHADVYAAVRLGNRQVMAQIGDGRRRGSG